MFIKLYIGFRSMLTSIGWLGLPAHTCRFSPTCSQYSRQAVKKYGLLKGGVKSLIRISRCHPFTPANK